MRTLLATTLLIGALSATPAAARDLCDPLREAERRQVFAALAEDGVRIAEVTGAGGITEFLRRADARACDDPFRHTPVAGVTSAGGITVR